MALRPAPQTQTAAAAVASQTVAAARTTADRKSFAAGKSLSAVAAEEQSTEVWVWVPRAG